MASTDTKLFVPPRTLNDPSAPATPFPPFEFAPIPMLALTPSTIQLFDAVRCPFTLNCPSVP